MSFTFESLPPSDPYFPAWQTLRRSERRSAWGCFWFFVVLPAFVYVAGRLVWPMWWGDYLVAIVVVITFANLAIAAGIWMGFECPRCHRRFSPPFAVNRLGYGGLTRCAWCGLRKWEPAG